MSNTSSRGDTMAASADGNVSMEAIKDRVRETLRTIRDPEIPVNICELGLIYGIDVDKAGAVQVRMTLTTPNCPVAGDLLKEVESKVKAVEGVSDAKVDLVWEPIWTRDMMSDAAKLALNLQGDDAPPDRHKDPFLKLGRLR